MAMSVKPHSKLAAYSEIARPNFMDVKWARCSRAKDIVTLQLRRVLHVVLHFTIAFKLATLQSSTNPLPQDAL